MTDYATWVRRQPLLARPGTPVWTTVQTQPNEALRQQLAALEPEHAAAVERAARTDPPAGLHGRGLGEPRPAVPLRFAARTRPTRKRSSGAMTLELLNLELKLIEPWAAAGSFVACRRGIQRAARCSARYCTREHARLLLPVWLAPQSQYVPPAIGGQRLVARGARRARGHATPTN